MIPFGEWKPDLADINNPATDAEDALPSSDGYKPLPSLQEQTNALTYYCRGAFSTKSQTGVAFNYAGDEKNLYLLSNDVWSEINEGTEVTSTASASDAYTVAENDNWEWSKWGENVIAVGGAESTSPLPKIAALDGTRFFDLGGTPPRAQHIAVVRNFVMMGNLYESAAKYPNRIRWSGINDETNWITDRAAQADYQDLVGNGGFIQSIRGGEYGLIFQERSIWRMDYSGPPEIFRLDEMPGIGTPAKNSIIQRGEACFFYGNDGFYVTMAGGQPQPIGRHVLDKFVENDFDLNNSHRMVGAEDKVRKVLWWIYPGQSNADGRPNKVVIYDYQANRWTFAEINCEWIYGSLGSSLDLDSFTAAGYPNLDTVGISLDSNVWKGGAITFGIFCDNHKQNQLTGAARASILTTQETSLAKGSRAEVTRVRPIVQGGAATVSVGTRNDLDEPVVWSAALPEKANGTVPMRSNARYHRFRVQTTGEFDRALGVLPLEVRDAGDR